MRISTIGVILVAMVLGDPHRSVLAQSTSALAPHARIRITAPTAFTPPQRTGRFEAFRSDSVVLHMDGSTIPLVLAVGHVERWEVSRGRPAASSDRTFKGMLIGAVLGAAIGAVTYAKPKCPSSQLFCPGLFSGRGFQVTAGALGGASVGTFFGRQPGPEQWERVEAPARP